MSKILTAARTRRAIREKPTNLIFSRSGDCVIGNNDCATSIQEDVSVTISGSCSCTVLPVLNTGFGYWLLCKMEGGGCNDVMFSQVSLSPGIGRNLGINDSW